jgi:hypothetical protein
MTAPIDFGPLPLGTQIANYLYRNLDAEELHQDMVTIVLPSGYSIYVDWFPEYDRSGQFWIRAAWPDGETDPVKKGNIADVQTHVKALVDRYQNPRVSRSASRTATGTEKLPEVSLG